MPEYYGASAANNQRSTTLNFFSSRKLGIEPILSKGVSICDFLPIFSACGRVFLYSPFVWKKYALPKTIFNLKYELQKD